MQVHFENREEMNGEGKCSVHVWFWDELDELRGLREPAGSSAPTCITTRCAYASGCKRSTMPKPKQRAAPVTMASVLQIAWAIEWVKGLYFVRNATKQERTVIHEALDKLQRCLPSSKRRANLKLHGGQGLIQMLWRLWRRFLPAAQPSGFWMGCVDELLAQGKRCPKCEGTGQFKMEPAAIQAARGDCPGAVASLICDFVGDQCPRCTGSGSIQVKDRASVSGSKMRNPPRRASVELSYPKEGS